VALRVLRCGLLRATLDRRLVAWHHAAAHERTLSSEPMSSKQNATKRFDASQRLTIGVFGNRQVYEGTTIVRYEQILFRGIRAAAQAYGCRLLLACGIGPHSTPFEGLAAWPMCLSDTNFVPVGPWNTDGLIAIPPFTQERQQALRELAKYGKPFVFTSPQVEYPSQAPTNAEGIRQAFDHLREHGHERIAFIAAEEHLNRISDGDGAERFLAYKAALEAHGLPYDPSLVGYGGHDAYQSAIALKKMLAAGAQFTAVLTSNDESAIGVMQALAEAGLRVPQDVAVIGFDDVLYAKAQSPPLTTVRHPTFEMGYQAVELLLEYITGQRTGIATLRTPTRLIIRESCGCQPYSMQQGVSPVPETFDRTALVQAMADAVAVETRYVDAEQLEAWCADLFDGFVESVRQKDEKPLAAALDQLLQHVETANEDPYAWQAAIGVLRNHASALRDARDTVEALIDQARIRISERLRRQHTRYLVRQAELTDLLGMLTMRLLTANKPRQILDILAEQLPSLGIRHAHIGLFEPEGDDPTAWCSMFVRVPGDEPQIRRFRSRSFPPPGLYDEFEPVSVAVLPLVIEDGPSGFVAIDASYLEPCGLIVRHLAAAFRNSQLYSAAEEGRQLAEEANRLKSRFLSTVSHELRTPLNLIIGLSEIMLRSQEQQAALPPTVQQDLERIFINAQHLGRLIGDVLDLASSEAGQLRLYFELLDLGEVLQAVAATGAQMAQDHNLAWRAELPLKQAWVRGDRTRLRQVVLNLISNAVKFTTQGEVALTLRVVDGLVHVSVSDTGPGVPLADQQQIFDEFRTSEQTAEQGYGGLGLGLTICKQLIERHDGTIGVISPNSPNGGATFYFTLPLLTPAQEEAPETLTDRSRAVFLTEQDTQDAQVVAALQQHGVEVQMLPINTDADWLPRLLAAPPDAVILDEPLASQRGWELLSMLKRHPATAQLPVLMYALDPQENRGALLELNYLLKPLDPEQLALVLAQQPGWLAQSSEQKTILVVDDDPDTLALHMRIIREQMPECRVLSARNGREALAVMEQTVPSLVLLDLMMPELDGFGVLEAMRARSATAYVPVVVLSAHILSDADMARLNHGVAAVLSKGLFTSDEIVSHLSSALAHQRKLSQTTQQFVRRAVAFIHEHYAEPITRDQIAAHVGISADYLTACFHQEMGVRPIAYLNRYRINRARILLEESNRQIIEIALDVGFTDLANFSRSFHREVGMTPNAYRKSKQR
jgi:signal transduction histidine kinase/AraC-like DNA-binding protein